MRVKMIGPGRLLIFLLVSSFLTFSSAHGQEINLDKMEKAGDLLCYQSLKDPNVYYYLPDQPRLAVKGGRPQFSFLKYARTKETGEAGIGRAEGGGVVHFLVTYGVDEDRARKAERALQEKHADARIAGPIVYRRGTFALITSFEEGNETHTRTVAVGKAPLMEGQKAAVSMALTREGAELLWESFKSDTPDISLVFDMEFAGVREPYEATLEANWERISNNHRVKAGFQYAWFGANVDLLFDELRQSGAVKITTKGEDATLDRIIDSVNNKLLQVMFDPMETMESPWSSESDSYGSLNQALRMMRDVAEERRRGNGYRGGLDSNHSLVSVQPWSLGSILSKAEQFFVPCACAGEAVVEARNKWEEARRLMRRNEFGNAYYLLDEALETFRTQRATVDYPLLYLHLARCCYHIGAWDNAKRYARQASNQGGPGITNAALELLDAIRREDEAQIQREEAQRRQQGTQPRDEVSEPSTQNDAVESEAPPRDTPAPRRIPLRDTANRETGQEWQAWNNMVRESRNICGRAVDHSDNGNCEEALPLFMECLHLVQDLVELGLSRTQEGQVLADIASCMYNLGRYEEAQQYASRAASMYQPGADDAMINSLTELERRAAANQQETGRGDDDLLQRARLLNERAGEHFDRDNMEEALAAYIELLPLAEELGTGVDATLGNIAASLYNLGRYEEAEQYARRAASLFTPGADEYQAAIDLANSAAEHQQEMESGEPATTQRAEGEAAARRLTGRSGMVPSPFEAVPGTSRSSAGQAAGRTAESSTSGTSAAASRGQRVASVSRERERPTGAGAGTGAGVSDRDRGSGATNRRTSSAERRRSDGSPGFSLVASYRMKHIKRSGKMVYQLNHFRNETQAFAMAENIGDLYRRYGNDTQVFRAVTIDDPVFKQREILVTLDGQDATSFSKHLNFVTVQMKKQHQSGELTTDEVVITPEKFNDSANAFVMSYGWKGDDDRSAWLDYRAQALWSFHGGVEVRTPWQTYTGAMLALQPPHRYRTLTIEGDGETLTEAQVRHGVVTVTSYVAGKPVTTQATIRNTGPAPSVILDVPEDREAAACHLSITWYLRGGKTVSAPPRPVEGEIVYWDELPTAGA